MGKVFVLLNSGAGTLRDGDGDAVVAKIEAALGAAGHDVEVVSAPGGELQGRLEARLSRDRPDTVIVGGGDGTVSGMAAALCETDIAMGILPLGTMNLFARSVGMPLDLDEGLAALAGASTRKVDLGEVNGRVFTHHVSMGLQPRLVAMREKAAYTSRAGKIFATFRALLTIMRQPPRLQVRMTLEGQDFDVETPALVVSNNMFGPAHLPYADALDQGVLGIYICTSHHPADVAQVTLEALLGSWHARDRIKTLSSRAIAVERRSRRRRRIVATVDGELVTFEGAIEIKIRPGCLTVLAPEPVPPAEDGKAAAPPAS
jgi:diacylglycerol kinase family enzyme